MIIPDIDMAQVERGCRAAGRVQYGTLNLLAGIFGHDMAPHRHDRGFQIHLVETGTLDLCLDGIAYHADAPVLFYTPASVPHAFRIGKDAKGHVVTVDRALVWEAADRDESFDKEEVLRPRCVPLDHGRRRGRAVGHLFRALRAETEAPGTGSNAVIEALATLIVIAFLRLERDRMTRVGPGHHHHDELLFRRFSDLIETHFADQLPLAWYADRLALTESRLTKLCRRVGGNSPKCMLLDRSMREARRLLAFSGHSVIEIASTLGYQDPSYFSRMFRVRHDRTPLQFRADLRESDREQEA